MKKKKRRAAGGGKSRWSSIGVLFGLAAVVCLSVFAIGSLTEPAAEPAAPATSRVRARPDITLRVAEATPVAPDRRCLPYIAPDGESYLCYARSDKGPELWLGTVSGGIDRLLVSGDVHFRWGHDSRHIVYSPWATPPSAPYPEPVYLMDLGTGDTLELGSTIRGNLIQTLHTGYVAFLEEEGLRIVNPLQGASSLVPIVFGPDQSLSPLPPTTEQLPEETAEARFGFLLTPEAMATVEAAPTSTPEGLEHWAWNADVKVRFEVSPDGRRVALLQVVGPMPL